MSIPKTAGRRQHWLASSLAPLALLLPLAPTAQAGTIDSFTVFQTITDTDPTPNGVNASTATGLASILGGQRDINVDLIATAGPGLDSNLTIGFGNLAFSNDTTVTGTALVQWDGPDQDITLQPTGLGGFDLTEGGTADPIEFQIVFADQPVGFRFTIEAYTDANNFSIIEFQAPAVPQGSPELVNIPFSLFQNCGSGPSDLGAVDVLSVSCGVQPVDFTNLGAMQMRFNTGPTPTSTLDLTITGITTVQNAAALGDFVWNDLDQDGIQDDNEPGIPNVTVNLWNCDASVNFGTLLTDANGFYLFDNLAPGNYMVEFVLPNGFVFSPQFQGGLIELDSNANPANGMSDCVELSAGETDLTIDAGMFQPDTAELGDFVWHDLDVDGIQDGNEPGIPGVIVELRDCLDNVIDTTVTDASGLYLFTDLDAGQYQVHFNLPIGFEAFTLQNQGANDAVDSDADANGDSACVTLAAGESNRTIDAGVYQLAALGDYLWEDLNRNGLQDDGDTGIGGAEVRLYRCDAPAVIVSTTATDANGFYLFDGLTPDEYFVEFVAPAGYVFTLQNQGADETIDSDANVAGITDCVTLNSGETNLDVDGGVFIPENPAIDIEKHTNGEDADTPTGPILAVGDVVTWEYFVTNTGNVDLVNVVVTDDQGVVVTCPANTLAVGAVMTCTANGIAEAGQYENVGTVVGFSVFDNTQVTDADPSHYFAEQELCDLRVTKTANPDNISSGGDKDGYGGDGYSKDGYSKDGYGSYSKSSYGSYSTSSYSTSSYSTSSYSTSSYSSGSYDKDGSYDKGGDSGACPTGFEVTYTYVISNLGSALTNVLVSDDHLGVITFPSQLASGQSVTVTETACIEVTTTNVVTVTSDLPSGALCSAMDSATVVVNRDDKDGDGKDGYDRDGKDGYSSYDKDGDSSYSKDGYSSGSYSSKDGYSSGGSYGGSSGYR